MTSTTAEFARRPLAASTEAPSSCQGAHAGTTHLIRLTRSHPVTSLVTVYLSAGRYDADVDGQFVAYSVHRQLLSNAGRPNETDARSRTVTQAAARWNLAQQSENPPWHDQDFEAGTTYVVRHTHNEYPGSAVSTSVFAAYRTSNPGEFAVLYETRWLISTDSADLNAPIIWGRRHRGTLDYAIPDADHAERTAALWADSLATAPDQLSGQYLDHTLGWHGIPWHYKSDDYPAYKDLVAGYIQAALWSTSIGDIVSTWHDAHADPPDPDTPLAQLGYDERHIAYPDSSAIDEDCATFFARNPLTLLRYAGAFANYPAAWRQAGHDFWHSRTLSGEGFDSHSGHPEADALAQSAKAFGETTIYVGDDDKIHVSPLSDPE